MYQKKTDYVLGFLGHLLVCGVALWLICEDYQRITRYAHLVSQENLAERLDLLGMFAVLAVFKLTFGLWEMLTWKFCRNLMNGIAYLAGSLIWGLTCALYRHERWEPIMMAFWLGVLIYLAGNGAFRLWKHRKQKLYEEML